MEVAMTPESSAAELLRRITSSPGAHYVNRRHQRSFSLNVFQMNALELMEAARRMRDPDQGGSFMMEKNREAGTQAHRELNRHLHNFTASAFTLVEHTRNFMRKHYVDAEPFAAYEARITSDFAKSPVAQFVQGLRNYILHRGMPNSKMHMKFTSAFDGPPGSGEMETGVRIETASLLEWDGWKGPAKAYLAKAGEELDVHQFTQEYLDLATELHAWLDQTLKDYHEADLIELAELQRQFNLVQPPPRVQPRPPGQPEEPEPGRFQFSERQTKALNELAIDILGNVRELDFAQSGPPGFPTDRPTVSITDKEIVGPVTYLGQEATGEWAFSFLTRDGKAHGVSETDHKRVDQLTDIVMQSGWARTALGRPFVEKCFLSWARQRFEGDGPSFSEALQAETQEHVAEAVIWVPVANFEVQKAFEFGPVWIEPITPAVIDSFRGKGPLPSPEQEEQVSQLFTRLRKDIQGRAAVVVRTDTEPSLAEDRAVQIARDVVGLLRFFSPAGPSAHVYSPIAIHGSEYVPQSNAIVLQSAGGISITSRVLPKSIGDWRMPTTQIEALQPQLRDAARLVLPEGLNDFELAVRSSLLTFSKGTTLVDPLDRLRNCLSALEGLLLKHEMEPRAPRIADRMSILLGLQGVDREEIQQLVRQVYWTQAQPQLTGSLREEDLIGLFVFYAHHVLMMGLGNLANFASKAEFVGGIELAGAVKTEATPGPET
jgi:hypothetical protein